jgi:ribosomal protein S18 acetylase RimI-like enzyme
MQELKSLSDVVAASNADPQCVWAAQGLQSGGAAWEHAGAVAIGCPALCGRDRLVVRGPVAAAAQLVCEAVAVLGPSYTPIGDAELMAGLLDKVGWLEHNRCYGWMDCTRLPQLRPIHEVRWLARCEWKAVDEVLTAAFPAPRRPWAAMPGIRRWAGIGSPGETPTCVVADGWSAPGVGFLTALAVQPHARRSGQGRDACGFVLGALLAAYGRVGLMVLDQDQAAISLYAQLGLVYRAQQGLRVASSVHS